MRKAASGTLPEAYIIEEEPRNGDPSSPSHRRDDARQGPSKDDINSSQDMVPAEALVDPSHKSGITLRQWLRNEVQRVADPLLWQNLSVEQTAQQHLVTAFRGLRVRMGLHSGLTSPQEWRLNKTTGRMMATGRCCVRKIWVRVCSASFGYLPSAIWHSTSCYLSCPQLYPSAGCRILLPASLLPVLHIPQSSAKIIDPTTSTCSLAWHSHFHPIPPSITSTLAGRFLSIAKAIGDVGAGGLIMLSAAAMESLSHFGLPPSTVIMHMGEHSLKELEGSQPLYCALHASLISRCVPARNVSLPSWGTA